MDQPAQERLLRLLSLHADGLLDDEQWDELDTILSSSKAARKVYIDHMFLHSMMDRAAKFTGPVPLPPEAHTGTSLAPTGRPSAGFGVPATVADVLGSIVRAGTGFLSRPSVLTLLLAVGLPGVLLLVLILHVARQPAPPGPVATVTQTYQAVWRKDTAGNASRLFAGEQVCVSEGIVQITFTRGARVLVEGPATFRVTGPDRGQLHGGRLVAHVGKGSEGFRVETRAVTLVDLGTEFGVRVLDERGTAEVEVFRGEIELQASAPDDPGKSLQERLNVGEAARIEAADQQNQLPTIRKIQPIPRAFVRSIPATPMVVADFSAGAGNTQANQFPGTAGAGWASGWEIGRRPPLECLAAVEESEPLLGGGKHLRALFTREAGASGAPVYSAIARQVAAAERVDLSRPYVVSFDLRIDTLRRFGEARDRLGVCGRRIPASEFAVGGQATSGWHVCITGKNNTEADFDNWAFLQRDDRGEGIAVDSGIAPREGSVYSFRIAVDPQARRWTPSIAVDGGPVKDFPPMRMRSRGTAKDNNYWAFLHFYTEMEGGSDGNDVEKTGFSVDSLRIEPLRGK